MCVFRAESTAVTENRVNSNIFSGRMEIEMHKEYKERSKIVFEWNQSEETSGLYLPLTNDSGIMSCITPDGHGDSKLSQNEFLLEPVSIEDLHMNMASRNIWCEVEGYAAWSAFGYSARQMAELEQDETKVLVGQLWQKHIRRNLQREICTEVLNFCPPGRDKVEIMQVTVQNEGKQKKSLRIIAAVPIYGRSADNLRDHRHVTSLLHRIGTTEDGVFVKPTLSFDERGHQKNEMVYGVYGREDSGARPESFYPVLKDFVGEGGSLLAPKVILQSIEGQKAGYRREGYEAMGGIRFEETILAPGEKKSYILLLNYQDEGMKYLELEEVEAAYHKLEAYWKGKSPAQFKSGQEDFDSWLGWVGIQPYLRRIYGCSFLPHHDYGKGGRGWRDLWQDCLALILTNPAEVRGDLINFYAGVRKDGSNATIIGSRPGEFKADRNAIVRVWMDHGYWPLLTTKFYVDQTGDYQILLEETSYFDDGITARGEKRSKAGRSAMGSVIEHILVQNITQYYDVGEHNYMRLRGADWNDAFDMAKERGESVAFTAAYSGNYQTLREIFTCLEHRGVKELSLSRALTDLMRKSISGIETVGEKQKVLAEYYGKTQNEVWEKECISIKECIQAVDYMREHVQERIRKKELREDSEGNIWFNGYYDNKGRSVEGCFASDNRVLLTSQVFTIMSYTATDDQVGSVCRTVDKYLYDEAVGGYRLNTNFHEIKLDMGRAFGFAYGHKENGAVFSHMAVMYAYALYNRQFAKEGYRVIRTLCSQSMNFDIAKIYPGIPEYFSEEGRGEYNYLTGAGSWLLLTVVTQMYGVRGREGNLEFHPQLLQEQFDREGYAWVETCFANRKFKIIYINPDKKEIGDYEIIGMTVNDMKISTEQWLLERKDIEKLSEEKEHVIKILLG